jgi:DNA polymerase III epsilon subunit-like protein
MKLTFTADGYYTLADFAFAGFSNRRFVVFDVESTGADSATDSVTQIGAVAVYPDGPRDTESFTSLVRPWKPIPEKIAQLTSVSNARVATAPNFASVWPEFTAFCGDSALVTQCGYEFDFPLLAAECARSAQPGLTGAQLDTKALFALLHPDRSDNFNTNFLSDHYAVDRRPFQRHDALGDAKLIARIFCAELAELRTRGLDRLATHAPVRIKRFVLPPLD